MQSPTFGYLTYCPSNLGTTLRASVHVKLPRLSSAGRLEDIAKENGLQVRGTGGEHTDAVDGIVDISNIRRLGLTEEDAVGGMFKGVMKILKEESLL